MMILSIIIPIYNGSATISTTLDSIWSQGLSIDEFEVICVDDCSTDDTYTYLQELALEHTNMRVLRNPENLRAGGARNYGVREAQGEYVVFIDADDYFHPEALRKVVEYQVANHLDILMCDNVRHNAGEDSERLIHNLENQSVMSGVEFMVKSGLPWAPWKYIFRRSMMVDNGVWFVEKVSCEDVDWTHKLVYFAQRMQYQPILLTHFVLNDTSQTATEFKNANIIWHRFYSARRVYDLIDTTYKHHPESHSYLRSVASAQYFVGVLYLNSFILKLSEKRDMIAKYIPRNESFHKLVSFAANNPMIYALLSNLASPLFRLAVVLKRKIKKRR